MSSNATTSLFTFRRVLLLLAGLFVVWLAWFFAIACHGSVRFLAGRVVFEYVLHHDNAEIEKESRSGDAGVYYFTSYYLNALLSAVEATGSERLLKKTLHYMDNMLATAQEISYKGKKYKAWGPFVVLPKSAVPKPNVHFTLQASVPLVRAAAIIRSHPQFAHRYENQAKAYVEFVDSAAIQYWYASEYGGHVPWIDAVNVPIWNDNGTNMGLVSVFLYRSTGNPLYAQIARSVGEAFQRKLVISGRGWIWESHTIPIGSDTDNTPGSVGNQAGVPDTSHTNREPFFMISLHEAGLMYERSDIERMGYTLIDNIWNQSYDNPSFANYMNGSNKPYRVYKEPGLNGPIYHGWVMTGGYLPQAQGAMVSTLKAILRGKKNPSLERNSTSYGGKLGLAGHILRNYAVANRWGVFAED